MNEPDPQPFLEQAIPAAWRIEVDARGMLCPLPIVHLGQALQRAAPGNVIRVMATDPGFFPDLLRWIRVRPARVLALREEPDLLLAWIEAGRETPASDN